MTFIMAILPKNKTVNQNPNAYHQDTKNTKKTQRKRILALLGALAMHSVFRASLTLAVSGEAAKKARGATLPAPHHREL
jgi:hypothetical protein